MNASENNFESLRRLMALKRHEIPPSGYFNGFSGQVMSRIRAGEAAESWEKASTSWLLGILQLFEAKPVYIGSFASSLCLLLLLGIVYAERPDTAPKSTLFAAMTQPAVSFADAASPALSQAQTGLMVSTNPLISLEGIPSFFGQQNSLAQQVNVSFQFPGN